MKESDKVKIAFLLGKAHHSLTLISEVGENAMGYIEQVIKIIAVDDFGSEGFDVNGRPQK